MTAHTEKTKEQLQTDLLKAQARIAECKADSDAEPSPERLVTGEGEYILIVDDEPSLALFIGEIVSMSGYQNTVVTNSVEALEIFKNAPEQFSMIITDQTMPNLSGIQLITEIKKITPSFPAIICSGYSDEISAEDADSQNISYFQKPVDTKALISKIDGLLK